MPNRKFVAKELANLFGVLSHPDRVRIVTELRSAEMDVNSLQTALGVSHSRVSQHLSQLRVQRMVLERREGRHVFYRLRQPGLGRWLLEGLEFVERDVELAVELRDAVAEVKGLWSAPPPPAVAEGAG